MSRFLAYVSVIGVLWISGCSTAEPADKNPTASNKPTQDNPAPPQDPGDAPSLKEDATTGEIYITVDETLKPLIEAQIDNFEALYPEATIHAIYLPGEQAIRQMLSTDTIRLAVSPRRLTKDEEKILLARQNPPRYANIFRDGIALMVNEENPVRQLTREQLVGIMSGELTKWSQINPEAEGDIIVVFDHAESSVLNFVVDSLLGDKPLLQKRYAQSPSPAVFDYVKTRKDALGVVGMAWIADRDDSTMRRMRDGLALLKLETRADTICQKGQQFIGPYQSYLYTNCYPLTRTINTISRESIFGLGRGFIAEVDHDRGQRIVHKFGLATVHTIPRRVKLPPGLLKSEATD
ncbi:MAG: substrate-binding domain-containing protein [Bacteroidota bacterium]